MDREKVKLIIRNLESLVECLKAEIYSEQDLDKQKSQYEEISSYIQDYDEVFCDDEDDVFETSYQNNNKWR